MFKLFVKKEPVKATVYVPTLQDRATAVVDNLKDNLLILSNDSVDALDTFRRTVSRIEQINDKIKEQKDIARTQIAELTQLVDSFDTAEASNNKIKGKIVEFLS